MKLPMPEGKRGEQGVSDWPQQRSGGGLQQSKMEPEKGKMELSGGQVFEK